MVLARIFHSMARPQPKERGVYSVYAASTLEFPQPLKREDVLESPNAEAA